MIDIQVPRRFIIETLWKPFCARKDDPNDPIFSDRELLEAERERIEREAAAIYRGYGFDSSLTPK